MISVISSGHERHEQPYWLPRARACLAPPAARWDGGLGEYLFDWNDVCASPDPHAAALEFAHAAFRHACAVCEWDPALTASAEGTPPPVA